MEILGCFIDGSAAMTGLCVFTETQKKPAIHPFQYRWQVEKATPGGAAVQAPWPWNSVNAPSTMMVAPWM
jgi:hypothetical protein